MYDVSGQEMFDGLIEKFENNFDKSMTSQMERLRASTKAFRKIANGYTQKKYLKRQSFLEFLDKDVVNSDRNKNESDSDYESANEGVITDEDDDANDNDDNKSKEGIPSSVFLSCVGSELKRLSPSSSFVG